MKGKSSNFFIKIIIIQLFVDVIILLDIPVFRQIVVFFYLSFLPGIFLLKILKLKLDKIETITFSMGLSIAFLMIAGLLINELYSLIGISEPLSMLSLLVTMNSAMCVFSVACYFKGEQTTSIKTEHLSPSVLLFIFLPFLSIFGASLVGNSGNNSLLMLLIILIAGLFVFSAHYRSLHPKFYPLILLSITIALFFHLQFISPYLIGGDIHAEYYVFQFTETNSRWIPEYSWEYFRSFSFQKVNAMLSVTILPTIYSQLLNLDGVYIFKIVFPSIFSVFISLGLYQLYRKQIGEKFAFLSTFFFISNFMIYEIITLNKQMIAEVFLILLIYLISEDQIGSLKKLFLFTVFSTALVVSHYATSYLFLFIIFLGWFFSYLKKYKFKNLKLTWAVLFFVITFSWYVYVSSSTPFVAVVNVGNNVLNSIINDFFNPAARGRVVATELGATAVSFGHTIGRLFYYATQFFIVVGFSNFIIKRKKKEISQEYLIISLISLFILILCIALPRFAGSLNVTRIYHVALISLSPFCILGGETVFRYLTRLKSSFCISFLVLIILIPYFLYNQGFIYEVTGDIPSSIPLSLYRMDKGALWEWIDYEQDVFSCIWLSQNGKIPLKVYGDFDIIAVDLDSYGSIPPQSRYPFSNIKKIQNDSYIVMGYLSAAKKIILGTQRERLNDTEIFSALNNRNKIYSNGGSEIYQSDSRP